MKTKILLGFIMMISLMSCKFYNMYTETAESGFLCSKGDDRFVTVYEQGNKDYDIYIRYNQFKKLTFDNIQRIGKPKYDSKFYRTEIQYIIVNAKNKNVFYISTTPSRYIDDKTDNKYLIGDKGDKANSYFFNSYFIGKMVGDTMMVFKNSKAKMTWKLKKTYNGLDIHTVIGHKIRAEKDIHSSTRLISEVLGDDFRFVKLNNSTNFTYFHQRFIGNSTKIKAAADNIVLKRIRYIACGNKATRVLLNYNTTIDENNKYKNIFYKMGRIRYIGDEDISYFNNLQKNKKD